MPNSKSTLDKFIGPYKIEGTFGDGDIGIIYKAIDTRKDKTVALKCLPIQHSDSHQNRERLLNEAKAVSKLDHPNICSLYDVGETDDQQLYIAMPFYDGYTLDKRMSVTTIPLEDIIAISLQIADGLHAAHSSGIVHRDIKPENVIITSEGTVKLLDFGFAKISGVDLTSTGICLGTLAYMSPEQLCGEKVDAKTDIWALGIILYEMLNGVRPFKGKHAPEIIHSILYADAPDLRVSTNLPDLLTNIFTKALARNKEDRYPSMIEFITDLRNISNEKTISPYVAETEQVKIKSGIPKDSLTLELDSLVIDELTNELSKHVGGVAPVLIKKAIKSSNNINDLCTILAEHLSGDTIDHLIRHRFNDDAILGIADKSDKVGLTLSTEMFLCMSNVTTSFIGPIGKLLVKRYAGKSNSIKVLCELLSEHMTNADEKQDFMNKIKKCC